MTLTFYEVRGNDQLYQILRRHYGTAQFLNDKAAITRLVLSNNPKITDINLIHPGQIIMLPDMATAASASAAPPLAVVRSCQEVSSRLGQYDAAGLSAVASVDFLKLGQTGGETFVSFVEKATANAAPDMKRIALNYYRKEAGTITRNQYAYQRSLSVKQVDFKIGPLHQLIHPGRKPGEVLRIQPHAAFRTQAVLSEVDQLARIQRLAKRGGVVLSVASLAGTAAEIHNAPGNRERTVVLLDAVAGLGGGAAATVIAVALLGTPVGWVSLAIVLGVGAVGGIAAEKLGQVIQQKTLFDANGHRIDVAADRIWQPFYGPQ